MISLTGSALTVAGVALFIVTLALVIVQPKGLSIGWSAAGGALVALAIGVDHLHNVVTVWDIVWNATITFVAVIIISLILDRIGFFEWAALHMLARSKGRPRRALLYLLTLGALVAAFFANDGAALILTPIVYQQVVALGFDRRRALPFVMAAGFIADTTSLPLVVSNLVNIVTANFFHIGFVTYAARMTPVDIVSFIASIGVLFLYYRKSLPASFDPRNLAVPKSAIKDHALFRLGWLVLSALLLAYIASGPLGFPVALPASLAAVVFLVFSIRSPTVSGATIIREAPWRIVVFSVGMYLVVYGLYNAGLTKYLADLFRYAAHSDSIFTALIGGFVTAFLSAIMNNMPTTLLAALSIHTAHVRGLAHEILVSAAVVGEDIGPKFTPIGSLATLLWLHVLDAKGIKITWGEYLRQGFVLTIPVLAVTLCALAGWLVLIH